VTDACVQVTVTASSQEEAERLAQDAVERRLAACAQVQGPVASTYRWEGRIEHAAEWYCHLKTTRARVAMLEARVRELHSYRNPEIIALPIVAGSADYLRWIASESAP
jgi:periplasmic divalent cation tolerance protein